MESMLKEKMFISSDIYKRECENAIAYVNQYLKKPIALPARCDFNRLFEIVKTIYIPEEEKLYLMEYAYLGKIDLKYKNFIEKKFDKKIINQFWKNRFKDHAIDSYEFKEILEVYLSYGFDFKDLFSYISLENTKEDYLKFIELIFTIEKNRDDLSKYLGLIRDTKDNTVCGFSLEFRYSIFGPEAADFSKCYTFDDYVNKLSKYFGKQIDVENFLKEQIKDRDG